MEEIREEYHSAKQAGSADTWQLLHRLEGQCTSTTKRQYNLVPLHQPGRDEWVAAYQAPATEGGTNAKMWPDGIEELEKAERKKTRGISLNAE